MANKAYRHGFRIGPKQARDMETVPGGTVKRKHAEANMFFLKHSHFKHNWFCNDATRYTCVIRVA